MKSLVFLVFACSFARAQFPNILISSQLEPKGVSIAINPKNATQIIAGAGMANAYYSEDSGNSWKKNDNICEAFNLYGQPIVFWDTARKAYFTDLAFLNPNVVTDGSWVDRVIVNRSENFGKSYTNCEDFGKNGKRVQYRHFACVDQKTNVIHVTWTQFSKFESGKVGDSSIIRHSKSLDGGKRWTDPKILSTFIGDCKNGDSTVMGATPCMGPDGSIYVSWAGPKGLVFQKSWNDGGSWMPQEKIILPLKNGWSYKVNGLYKANGLPGIACDLSKGAFKGRIYICWSDEKNGVKNKDVFLTYSDDKGENWVDPVLITYHPNHKEQFMPVMTIDQSTGYIYILYYDQQNFQDEGLTDVSLAISKNGGLKFDIYKVNEKSFKPLKDGSFGDYISVSAVNSIVRPIWMQQDKKKELNVYTAMIDEPALQKYNATKNADLELEKSVKFSEQVKINFSLKSPMEITAVVSKPLEPDFEKVVIKNKKFKAGNNTMLINSKELGLQKGSYILTLYYNNKNTFTWITEE
ncbi:MAG: exo-alpha-sialidase [Bacteroidetes bacterium]|nr:exo-alpha-sialidase [Bacteroidota bacterium]